MCGVLFAKIDNLNDIKFKQALELMQHRGPDFSDFKYYNSYFLGQNRLAIIDLDARSNQPFLGSDGASIIIFNGEIYNYLELAKQFNLQTKTNCDTEIIIELYLKLGKDFIKYLNGCFVFIIFNTITKEYFIARDRLGIKPLYFWHDKQSFIVSSELLAILHLTQDTQIDTIGLRQYLKFRTFFRGHTIYKNIKMFPAASYCDDLQNIQQYWHLEESAMINYNPVDLHNLILSAVKYRLIADVSIGSYLSGGLDSSIITAIAKPEHTWTIGFENNNEFEYSDLVAKKYNLQHHKILIDNDEFLKIAKQMILTKKEPLSVPNEVLLYKLTQKVAGYNKVILSGEGADELFCGYDRIFKWANNKANFTIAGFDKMYSYGKHKDDEIIEYILEPFCAIKNNYAKTYTFFQKFHLHGLLKRLDSSSMLHSVEARVPFCDHRLVEYLYNIPLQIKMQNNIVKYPLKKIFANLLPLEIINRKKVGFPVNTQNIFNNKHGMASWFNFNLVTLFGPQIYDLINDISL